MSEIEMTNMWKNKYLQHFHVVHNGRRRHTCQYEFHIFQKVLTLRDYLRSVLGSSGLKMGLWGRS